VTCPKKNVRRKIVVIGEFCADKIVPYCSGKKVWKVRNDPNAEPLRVIKVRRGPCEICHCESCPTGVPAQWTINITGCTGVFVGMNGRWTLKYSSPPRSVNCRWVQRRGPWFSQLTIGGPNVVILEFVHNPPGGYSATYTLPVGFPTLPNCCGPYALSLQGSLGFPGSPASSVTMKRVGPCGKCTGR
jgi:hypothetical protein